MENPFEEGKFYVVSGSFMRSLESLKARLYTHDSKRINADESRDWANWLYAQLPHAEEIIAEELRKL